MAKVKEKAHGTLTLHGVDTATPEVLRLMTIWLRTIAKSLKSDAKHASKVSRYTLMK